MKWSILISSSALTDEFLALTFSIATRIALIETSELNRLLVHGAEGEIRMGPVRIRHSSHNFGWQSSHSVDLAGWQAKMASIEIWIP